jgi:hypothetical protein
MRILTFALCLLCFSVSAQNNSINVYPWNPDSDNDNQIGVDDLQSFLTVYGNDFGLPPEPCTYDGTELEDLLTGILTGTIILDSLFFEFELEQTLTYYVIGCPDPVTETATYVSSAMLDDYLSEQDYWYIEGSNPSSGGLGFQFEYQPIDGKYKFRLYCWDLFGNNLSSDGFFGGGGGSLSSHETLPLPDWWYLDENGIHLVDEEGIHISDVWETYDWPYYANYMHILPYWHYADE